MPDVISHVPKAIADSLLGVPISRLTVAYSGGLDSVVLLHALIVFSQEKPIDITACHINHGLNMQADKWEDHCRIEAASVGAKFDVQRVFVNCEAGTGVEAAARSARYAAFDSLDTDLIFLGHHQDDQAETVLLNLLRGSGVLGLSGMRLQEGRFCRPFLNISRKTLHVYALENNLKWIEDDSNENIHFSRNYIRHHVLPLLSVRYPQLTKGLVRSASHFAEAQGLLEELACIDDPSGDLEMFPVDITVLAKLSNARLVNLLRCKLKMRGYQSPDASRIWEFARQLKTYRPDRHPTLDTTLWTLYVRQRQLHLVVNDPA